jgi:hypothetical protein
VCNTFQNSQPPEPMYERDIPSVPWQMLGTDLFDYGGHKYLLLVDYTTASFSSSDDYRRRTALVSSHTSSRYSQNKEFPPAYSQITDHVMQARNSRVLQPNTVLTMSRQVPTISKAMG